MVPCDRGALGIASSESDDVRWGLYGECESDGDAVIWWEGRPLDAEAGIGMGAVPELSVDVARKDCRASVMALTQLVTSCAESACK